ncbi:MAG: adenylosuccinate synthetase [Polyangiaceae bacterium]|nr:adenylosuccinate synthetase [Polyangiaceae bacterium]
MSAPAAFAVVDLGFGDAGKGHVVDWLVRRARAGLVVRFNGGAQAGHTVVLDDGRAHTFSQLGAGTFVPGVRAHLGPEVVVHPTALAAEARALAATGVLDALDRLSIDARCRLVTPFHQALNRLRELARGAARHGSCGVGIGEVVVDSLAHPDEVLTPARLRDRTQAARVLARVRERKRAEAAALPLAGAPGGALALERRVLDDPGVTERWLEAAVAALAPVRVAQPGERPPGAADGPLVFEGAQGLLLDERFGFPPHTTWGDCTPARALALLAEWGDARDVEVIGVHRAYHVRHGAGPLPTETDALGCLEEPHNAAGPWQGRFRRGWLDLGLLGAARAALPRLDTVACTHLDALDRPLPWRVVASSGEVGLPADPTRRRAALLAHLEDALDRPVRVRSHGPRTADVALA